ncbi:uncharacterized protein LOC143890267 [Tasmannia lanceolata]|uniref:uncharacterized protein LOC143890267 n=1 Tax=Tasmannia lanceolata TaxID=3420 RepID=UPI0040646075
MPSLYFVSTHELWQGGQEVSNSREIRPVLSRVWEPPRSGFLKLNFDGSNLGNPGPAGIGGILRVEDGNTRCVVESNEAEMRAAHNGILMLEQHRLNNVIVEGDSSNVIKWLEGSSSPPWRFAHGWMKSPTEWWVSLYYFTMLGGQLILRPIG